jgi:hypothetical protein
MAPVHSVCAGIRRAVPEVGSFPSRDLFLVIAQCPAGPRRPGEEVIAVMQLDRVVVADRLVPAARAALQSEACRDAGLLLDLPTGNL